MNSKTENFQNKLKKHQLQSQEKPNFPILKIIPIMKLQN